MAVIAADSGSVPRKFTFAERLGMKMLYELSISRIHAC